MRARRNGKKRTSFCSDQKLKKAVGEKCCIRRQKIIESKEESIERKESRAIRNIFCPKSDL